MKYLEELIPGDCFEIGNDYYVVSSDFKAAGDRMCLSLKNGFSKWLNPNIIVNITDIFTLDNNNNIIAIKERSKDDNLKNQNFS